MKRQYDYVAEDNPFMRQARRVAEAQSLDKDWPTGVVVVKVGKIIGKGWNGSEYHQKYGCRRKELGIKTGERYDLCEGCDPRHHAEPRAIANARLTRSVPVNGEVYSEGASSAYLWGHWWCCESCWQVMIDAGIKKVYLVKGANVHFSKVRNNSVNARGQISL